jgi:hypothetical protein
MRESRSMSLMQAEKEKEAPRAEVAAELDQSGSRGELEEEELKR